MIAGFVSIVLPSGIALVGAWSLVERYFFPQWLARRLAKSLAKTRPELRTTEAEALLHVMETRWIYWWMTAIGVVWLWCTAA